MQAFFKRKTVNNNFRNNMKPKEKTFEQLFSEFPPVSTEEWEKVIEKDLKGADYARKLIWRTNEGFEVKPYYRAEDLEKLNYLNAFPGEFPFVRGNKTDNNNWLIRQDIIVENVKEANAKAIYVIKRGIESVGFNLTEVLSTEDMDILLGGIDLAKIEINLICGSHFDNILEAFINVLKERNVCLDEVNGSITYNPLTEMVLTGVSQDFEDVKEILDIVSELPKFKIISIHGSIFHNSGSSSVEELGFSLATAAEYLDQLTEAGININELAPRIKFEFAVGGNYFMEIAKIRAARMLWAKMVEAYQPKDANTAQMFVHSTTSNWNKTIYDPYVNMLRTTTEAMSSVIGGTDSLTVNAFDEPFETPTEFGERIARNQQLLLKEESYMDKVADPAAGSYYIENLTNSIANEAWRIFLAVEEKGGFIAALKDGFVQNTIKETAQKRDMNIANRKEIFLGTNQFPNFTEKMEKELEEDIFAVEDYTDENAEFETLKPYRGAQAFEMLRYKTDVYSKEKKRPLAFMLTYGNLGMRKARATFACNFFACAGFEVVDNNGFENIAQGLEAAKKAGADIIVLCSSDAEYESLSAEDAKQIDNKILVVAGYPKDMLDALKEKGVKYFIHVKSNVLDTLNEFQKSLGI